MLRFALACALIAAVAADNQMNQFAQYEQQTQQMNARQGIGANANLGFGDFGNFNAGGQLNLPSNNDGLLPNIAMGLGLLLIANMVVNVATPYFTAAAAPATPETAAEAEEAKARNARMLNTVAQFAIQGIEAVKAKYE